jgi:hypothetical protein
MDLHTLSGRARHRRTCSKHFLLVRPPIFTTFSRKLVSDHRSTSPGSAKVRRKLARW